MNNKKLSLVYLSLGCVIVVLIALFLVLFLRKNNASEELEELKSFIVVEKEGEAKNYSSEAVKQYVAWAYGDGWCLAEQNPYGSNGEVLKFIHDNGNYFHVILGTTNGTKTVNGSILPDDNHYYKTYTDTYEYEILKCHRNEIAQLAKQLSLDADIMIEDHDPATSAYIILNNVEYDRDFQRIAKFMVEASKIVDYNINSEMKKSEMGLNVTANLSGGDNEPSLALAKNQDERDKHNEDYYITELESQLSER